MIVDKKRENRMRWFDHGIKREKSEVVRMIIEMNAEGSKERETPKKRLLDAVKCDLRTTGMCVDDVRDLVKWWFRTQVADFK